MGDVVIHVQGLSKRYRIGEFERYKALRDTFAKAISAPFWAMASLVRGRSSTDTKTLNGFICALDDISFEVERGDIVGIIGRNGAGKSTLLKILSRIIEPTQGYAKICGRVGSLLEVGTGFHPELTGRENLYLNGAILGMRKAEIARKFDEIVSFAEVERFIDMPVKYYSSGMYVRLAFAVAAHLEPEVLLVDEVLAVGDVAFQRRCMGKMRDVTRQGRTILFVSHNIAAIQALCHRVCLLDKGRILMAGDTNDVIQAYLSSLESSRSQPIAQRADRPGDGALRFVDVIFRSRNGTPVETVQSGQPLEIAIAYRSNCEVVRNVAMHIGIFTLDGHCMSYLNNEMIGTHFDSVAGVGEFSCLIPRLPLTPGEYYLNLYCEVNGLVADWVQHAASLTVEAGDFFGTGRLPPRTHGGMLVTQTWSATGAGEYARCKS